MTGAPPHLAPHAGLDPRARRFLDLIAAGAKTGGGPPALYELRAATDGLAAFAAPPPPVERRDETLAGARVAVRLYAPRGSGDAPAPALLYFHGGGCISGWIASHDAICATLAARGLCQVIAVDYRLAPEHRFPAALDDGRAALEAIAPPGRAATASIPSDWGSPAIGGRQSRRRRRARSVGAAGAATAAVPGDGSARPHAVSRRLGGGLADRGSDDGGLLGLLSRP